MNRTILISYDLGVPESTEDYQKVIGYIKSLGSWAKPLKSLFLVKSDKSCSSIRGDLNSITDSNDGVLVMDVTGVGWATGRIPTKITDWMYSNV